jgi:DNA-binding CsgD family transcriptional regulator/tetratricopeptide (TPR) repeat protein
MTRVDRFPAAPERRNVERRWSDLTMVSSASVMDDLPGPIGLSPTFPFVGRAAELETLRALTPAQEGLGRRTVLVGGEPGSGKSRLVREFTSEAAAAEALVLFGACDAVVRTPYGPFVEALEELARVTDADELRAAVGTGGGELTRLVPGLPARIGELPAPVAADPDTERHRLHTAVTDLLVAIGATRPLLLVVEDGHWADAPTLLLLRHLARARAGRDARILIVATFRDAEADVPGTLAEILADLRGSDDVVRMRLGGLSGDEVSEFVRRAAGGDLGAGPPELATTIGDLTEGNPFLVSELWRALVETNGVAVVDGRLELVRSPAELGTPDSVREVVSQRLSRLAPATTDLLELGATAGSEFELATIRSANPAADDDLAAALEEAVRSGILEELPGSGLSYRFTHELVRRALYDRLSAIRRAELHLRVAETLEEADGRGGRALADLAHHFAATAPLGETERAIKYNLLAARAAAAALAFDEAAARLHTALDLRIPDPQQRAEIYLELGTASHRAGKAGDALWAFVAASEIARDLGDGELLAAAAIGYEEACWRPGIADEGAVELLEEAATALGGGSSELRVGLLAGLARALDFRGEHERAAVVRAGAIEMAREIGDRTGLATVLMRSYWSRGVSSLDEILGHLTEARDIAGELGNTEIRAEAMAWRVPAFVAVGDLDSARAEVATVRAIAEQTAQPFLMHVAEHHRSAIALGDGRLDEAEEAQRRSHEWSRVLTGRDATGVHGIQMFSIVREQGRLEALAPVLRILAGEPHQHGPWRPGLVSLLVELGMEDEAREELTRIVAEGLDQFRESLWLASLTYLTDACAALGHRDVAAIVYPELEPLSGANVMIGHLVAYYGSADRYLGMLAATLGEGERAAEHFELALDLNRRMGAATWLAHTFYEYARLLLAPESSDRERGTQLLAESTDLAERIGMASLLRRARALEAPAPVPELPDGLSPREAEILRLVARGLSNREIGAELFISEHTAANHIRNILRKTDSANRTEAASYAHRHGLAEAPR